MLTISSFILISCKKDKEDPKPSINNPQNNPNNQNPQNNPTNQVPGNDDEAYLYMRATIGAMKVDYTITTGEEPCYTSSNTSSDIASNGGYSTFIYRSGIESLDEGRATLISIGT